MAHVIRDRKKLLDRVHRIRGQVEAIEKALLRANDCRDVLHSIAACRGAVDGLMGEVIEGHIRYQVVNPDEQPNSEQAKATQELIDVLKIYMK